MSFALERLSMLCLCFVFDLLIAIFWNLDTEQVTVGHVSHASGALGGFIIGFCVMKTFRTVKWKPRISTSCVYFATTWIIFGLGATNRNQFLYLENDYECLRLQETTEDNYYQNCTCII